MFMCSYSGGRRIPRTLALFLALIAAIAFVPSLSNAQNVTKKLTEQDVIELLTGDASNSRCDRGGAEIGHLLSSDRRRGQSYSRRRGGSEELIRVLRSLAPRAPVVPSAAAPTLMIQSTPGQCQVYIDDEPLGTTSPEGRLKLTQLAPGSHSVRLSLAGYQDYEKTVNLSGGQTTSLAATLEPGAPAPEVPPVNPEPVEPPAVNPNQPGYLGIIPAQEQPAGARGVVISGARPGGPGCAGGAESLRYHPGRQWAVCDHAAGSARHAVHPSGR